MALLTRLGPATTLTAEVVAGDALGAGSLAVGAGAAVKTAGVVAEAASTSKVAKTASGKRVEDFTPKQNNDAKVKNAAANGGQMACTDCGLPVVTYTSQKGVPTPVNGVQIHHDPAIHKGGTRATSTPIVLCPECHIQRHRNEK